MLKWEKKVKKPLTELKEKRLNMLPYENRRRHLSNLHENGYDIVPYITGMINDNHGEPEEKGFDYNTCTGAFRYFLRDKEEKCDFVALVPDERSEKFKVTKYRLWFFFTSK